MRPTDRVLVVHVQRTAGTSLRHALDAAHGPGTVYPSPAVLAARPGGRYESAAELLERKLGVPDHRFLFGHFIAAFADVLPIRYRTATFLRDPVARSVSIIEHHAAMSGRPVSELLGDEKFLASHVTNHQTRVFGTEVLLDSGATAIVRPQEAPAADRATLRRAAERLASFDFVGTADQMDDSIERFDRVFGTAVAPVLQRLNASGRRDLDRGKIARLVRPLVELDLELLAQGRV